MTGWEIFLAIIIGLAIISIVSGACSNYKSGGSTHHANDIYINPIRDELKKMNDERFK
jgi:hypothetical protein